MAAAVGHRLPFGVMALHAQDVYHNPVLKDFVDDAMLLIYANRPAARKFILELFGLADTRGGGFCKLEEKSLYAFDKCCITASLKLLVFSFSPLG